MLIVIRPRVSLTAAHRAHIPKWLSHSVAEWLKLPIEWLLLPSALIHGVQSLVFSTQCVSDAAVEVVVVLSISLSHLLSGGSWVQLADLRLDRSLLHPPMASFNWIGLRKILSEKYNSVLKVVGLVQLADGSWIAANISGSPPWNWKNWIGRVAFVLTRPPASLLELWMDR